MPKAHHADQAFLLEDIPNVGPAVAAGLRDIGITKPADLRGRQPLELYRQLGAVRGVREDPCVLDTFMAAIDFMQGGPARPWWHYTAERKRRLPSL